MNIRRDIFPHFLNRDSREIYGLFVSQPTRRQFSAMLRGLNVAAMLCEERCVMPPGFVVECDIALALLKAQKAYFRDGLISLPMRESSLADFAEKKRREYGAMRERYAGLFDDKKLSFLAENEGGIVSRGTRIGQEIADQWRMGPDQKRGIWLPVKAKLDAGSLAQVRDIPAKLVVDGAATTWAAIEPLLPRGSEIASSDMRRVLQHVYFQLYMREFGLVVLRAVPLMHDDFDLPSRPNVYRYDRIVEVLRVLGIADVLIEAEAEVILDLRRKSGFIHFMDCYAGLADMAESNATLVFHVGRAKDSVTFDWVSFARRFLRSSNGLFSVSPVEANELADALGEVGNAIAASHDVPVRKMPAEKPMRERIVRGAQEASLVLFVALNEELEILCRELGLRRNDSAPAAHGQIGGVDVAVLCPGEMGRVPAAVETAIYLSRRKTLPELIVVAGLAGAIPENKVTTGDVIFARNIVDLANRKVRDKEDGATRTEFRRRDFPLSLALWNVKNAANFPIAEWREKVIYKANWPEGQHPPLKEGPVASVDEVVASDPWRKTLLDNAKKLLAVEMEAGGVCAAAEKFKVPVAVLRAISDHADPSKADDEWRRRGMIGLATLLEMLPLKRALELA